MSEPPIALPVPSVRQVLDAVVHAFDATPVLVLGPSRDPGTVAARQAVCALARELTGRSYPELGRILRKDHTTVLSACRRHAARLGADPDYAARVRRAQQRINTEISSHV